MSFVFDKIIFQTCLNHIGNGLPQSQKCFFDCLQICSHCRFRMCLRFFSFLQFTHSHTLSPRPYHTFSLIHHSSLSLIFSQHMCDISFLICQNIPTICMWGGIHDGPIPVMNTYNYFIYNYFMFSTILLFSSSDTHTSNIRQAVSNSLQYLDHSHTSSQISLRQSLQMKQFKQDQGSRQCPSLTTQFQAGQLYW